MFKFLRRSKVTVTVDVEPSTVAPGGQVAVRAAIDGELDDKVEGMQVGIRCTTRYLVRERVERYDRDKDSFDRYEEKTVERTDTAWVQTHDVALADGAGGSFGGSFTVPADALPSADGAVEWEAFASVSRRRGLDPGESTPLTVTLPAERLPGARRPETIPFEDITFRFEGVPEHAKAGDELTGTLVLLSKDEVSTTGMKISLRLERTDSTDGFASGGIGGAAAEVAVEVAVESLLGVGTPDVGDLSGTIRDTSTVAEVDLGGGELPAGQECRFEFTIRVPSGAAPTLDAPNTKLVWRLQATVARRMRGDFEAQIPIGIFTA